LVGDAAYECTDWCLTPYPGRLGKGLTIEKDNYNFYQSQMRINIERTFGMLVKRFGILGRAQTSPLDHVSLAVAVCIKVHNECIKDSDFADDFDDSAMNTMDDHTTRRKTATRRLSTLTTTTRGRAAMRSATTSQLQG
jgi:hypothetical protein